MLADGDGMLVLANRRMEEIFCYQQDDLAGHPVESLIPADLHMAHHSHRADYAQAPETRPWAPVHGSSADVLEDLRVAAASQVVRACPS